MQPYQFAIDELAALKAHRAEFVLENEDNIDWDVQRRIRNPLEPLLLSDLQIQLRFRSKKKRLADFQSARWTGTHLVSERFRALVEQFEPRLHLFYPVEIRSQAGELLPETHYLFKVGVRLENAYDETRTAVGRVLVERSHLDDKNHIFVWRRKVIEGHHLWSDARLYSNYFCSDAFRDAVVKERMKWLEWRADEVI